MFLLEHGLRCHSQGDALIGSQLLIYHHSRSMRILVVTFLRNKEYLFKLLAEPSKPVRIQKLLPISKGHASVGEELRVYRIHEEV